MAVAYSIGAASKLTGISADTLRAWERRYAAVTPQRGGRRRGYNQEELERLILLRRAVERGHTISSVANLPVQTLRNLLEADRGEPADVAALIRPLLASLEDFDYAALNEQLRRMAALLPPEDLVHQVVLPLMREVGERWHRGQLSVAQEHMMTGLTQHLLGTLLGAYWPAPTAPRILYTTPEGELHSLGILAAAILAAGAGLSPIYLGPSLPAKEIVRAARRSRARAVVLQLTDPAIPAAALLRQTRQGLPRSVEIWLGGEVDLQEPGVLRIRDFTELKEHYQRLASQ